MCAGLTGFNFTLQLCLSEACRLYLRIRQSRCNLFIIASLKFSSNFPIMFVPVWPFFCSLFVESRIAFESRGNFGLN